MALRQKYTESAVLYEKTLRPSLKRMNDGKGILNPFHASKNSEIMKFIKLSPIFCSLFNHYILFTVILEERFLKCSWGL